MGKANLILIANFAEAKMVSGQSQFFPQKKESKKPSVTTFYRFLLLATCFGFWESRHQVIKNIREERLFK
jgi:hypothetical protein